MTKTISLDAATIITGISKRTLWRRVTDGQIDRLGADTRGRTMLAWADIIPLICIEVNPDDYQLFLDADNGDAESQNDLAVLFLEVDRPDLALPWLQLAADQGNAVAMHDLAMLYLQGGDDSTPQRDEAVAMMWLAKAASHGNVIAREQLDALLSFSRSK